MCCLCTCGCTVLGIWLLLVIYLGIYSFNNPDNDAWLGHLEVAGNSKVLQMQLYPNETDLKAANATHNVHVHARLVTWFTWGFWNFMAPIGVVVFS